MEIKSSTSRWCVSLCIQDPRFCLGFCQYNRKGGGRIKIGPKFIWAEPRNVSLLSWGSGKCEGKIKRNPNEHEQDSLSDIIRLCDLSPPPLFCDKTSESQSESFQTYSSSNPFLYIKLLERLSPLPPFTI